MSQVHKFGFVPHGLGDQSNAIHLFDLWRRRGDKFLVHAGETWKWLWEAAGYKTCDNANTHPWPEPPAAQRDKLHEPYDGNKSGHNMNGHPLEWIGPPAELWPELVATRFDLDHAIGDDVKADVARLLDGLPRPVILWHSRGNTSPHLKNPPRELEEETGQALLDIGSVVYLEYGQGRPEYRTHRYRPVTPRSLAELYWLTRSADVLVGVDSGPFHFARFTKTPRVGTWFSINYWHACIPSPETVNVQADHGSTPYKRFDFNAVSFPTLTGERIANVVRQVLAPRKYSPHVGPDVVLQNLLPHLRHKASNLTTVVDRNRSFGIVFDFLMNRHKPVVVETGCCRSVDDWGAGWFGPICGYMLATVGGHLTSVDTDPQNVAFAREWTKKLPVSLVQSDSVAFLEHYSGPKISVAYLDSLDTDHHGHAEHALREAKAVVPHVLPDGLIVYDDSPWDGSRWIGKGASGIPWLISQGFRVMFSGYQCVHRGPEGRTLLSR